MADLDPNLGLSAKDQAEFRAKQVELDRKQLQRGIDESTLPSYNAATARAPDAGSQRNQAANIQRSNASGKKPAQAQAPPAVDRNDSLSSSDSDSSDGYVDHLPAYVPAPQQRRDGAIGGAGGGAAPGPPMGIALKPPGSDDSDSSDGSDEDAPQRTGGGAPGSSGSNAATGGGGGGGGAGAGASASASFEGAKHTVMVVCGGPTPNPKLNPEQEERVKEVMSKIREKATTNLARAERKTRAWVHSCFSRSLPSHKCASRELNAFEKRQRKAQLRALEAGLNDPANVGARPTSHRLRDEDDIDRLVDRTSHAWLRGPSDIDEAKGALREQYDAFMLEERCCILRIVKEARARRITCEEAELAMEKEVEGEYMEALLEEEPLISECVEARRFDVTKIVEHKSADKYDPTELEDFTKQLKDYINAGGVAGVGKRSSAGGKRSTAGADEPTAPKPPFIPKGTAEPTLSLHSHTQCDVCTEWKMEKMAWLARDEAEMNEILNDPDYQAAMKRLFELRAELGDIDSAWPKRPAALLSYFNNQEPLAAMVDTDCPKQKGDTGFAEAQRALKRPNPKPEQRRLLDEVIIQRGVGGCENSSNRRTTHTDTLLTEMLRCFPVNKGDAMELNPLLDFLCWYRQHITLAAKYSQDGKGTTTRSLFYQALCAPMVYYEKTSVKKDAQAAGFSIAAYPLVVQHKAIYNSIDTSFTKINKAAALAFDSLMADLRVARAESVLYRHNQALYASCKAMYDPQRS